MNLFISNSPCNQIDLLVHWISDDWAFEGEIAVQSLCIHGVAFLLHFFFNMNRSAITSNLLIHFVVGYRQWRGLLKCLRMINIKSMLPV